MLRTRQKTAAEMGQAPKALPPSVGREFEPLDYAKRKTAPVAFYPAATKPAGRPASGKEVVTLRLSPDVIAKFRATGKGWQARIDEALRKATP